VCGRYTLAVDADDLREVLPEIVVPEGVLGARYNIAPTQDAAVVPNDGSLTVATFRWGLVPSWADDPRIGNRMINARAETLAEKPSFRTALRRRRCLVLADGFYEWRAEPGRKAKTPYFISLAQGEPFGMGGLWESWEAPDGSLLRTFTIVTVPPNELCATIHDRMPFIVPAPARSTWLDPRERKPEEILPLLAPYPASAMRAVPVSTLVNSPSNDTAACRAPA
jgi:putative SOS response-associated peptidase YedK